MTIDEAISKYRNRVEQYKDWENMKDIAEEHKQLAEWLEELKEYKANNHPKCSECAGCTQWLCDCSNVRNKAIDDFANKIREIIETSMIPRANELETIQALEELMSYSIGRIAEQLKEGGVE